MRIVTERDLVKTVAERWKAQYGNNGAWGTVIGGSSESIYRRLLSLPPDARAADVEAVVGNDSWVGVACSECHEHANDYVLVGDEPDYESDTVYLCYSCALKVADQIVPKDRVS